MMLPPTALPRSLSENLNPPPVDPVVRGERTANGRARRGGVARLVALFRRQPRDDEPLDLGAGLGLVRLARSATDYRRSGSSVPPSPPEMRRQM